MIIVAGIVRSGLSVTMQMLHAGGFPCAGEAPAFEDYPMGEIPWLACGDKAVKLVDAQLQLPPDWVTCDVIRLRRSPHEQAKSFNKFNGVFGFPPCHVGKLMKSIERDYVEIDDWAKRQQRMMVLDFETIIREPQEASRKIRDFVNAELDVEKMAAVVRERSPDCYPTMLELELI